METNQVYHVQSYAFLNDPRFELPHDGVSNASGSPGASPNPSRPHSQSVSFRSEDAFLLSNPKNESRLPMSVAAPPTFFQRSRSFFTGSRDRVFKRLFPLLALVVLIIVAIAVGVAVPLSRSNESQELADSGSNGGSHDPAGAPPSPTSPSPPSSSTRPSGPVNSDIPDIPSDAYHNEPRLVFAHYMLITRPPNANFTPDIIMAKAAGIDAFAINYGGVNVDYDTERTYLSQFYNYCTAQDFFAFLSFDTTSTDSSGTQIDPQQAVDLFNQYNDHPAQLKVNGSAVLSSFQTADPSWNWQESVLSKLNASVHFLPHTLSTHGEQVFAQDIGAEGYFSWMHHDLNATQEAATDASFASSRNQSAAAATRADKPAQKWMVSLAPWFYKNLGAHWAQAQDSSIFIPRLKNLLRRKPDYIELVTWNDFGESTYFGPLNANLTEMCPECYYAHLEHGGFLDMMKPVIRTFKAGETEVLVDEEAGEKENVWLFYRLQPARSLPKGQDSSDLPELVQDLRDKVFIVSFVKQETEIKVEGKDNGGKKIVRSVMVERGLSVSEVDWAWGNQTVTAVRGDEVVVEPKTGPAIVDDVVGYNGNVVVV
ncbi:glycoside hydrolase family 71 protein [Aulographum hederae CBS 113979]|uniref:Glycoside hydrolase family 71 protein n=1 Tax=Aulographum hederae CBS 113979 TaxID=1176131 RepID=A0A6G1GR42_9PEZI|nr:glycoside hydrolase family 71 protein [Aulographum hederae CBS 113979]